MTTSPLDRRWWVRVTSPDVSTAIDCHTSDLDAANVDHRYGVAKEAVATEAKAALATLLLPLNPRVCVCCEAPATTKYNRLPLCEGCNQDNSQ